jgi:hypothetical protein
MDSTAGHFFEILARLQADLSVFVVSLTLGPGFGSQFNDKATS